VPTLRHPTVNATAAAALSAMAPHRVAVAFGTGFAGARAMGGKPASWKYLADYVPGIGGSGGEGLGGVIGTGSPGQSSS
jgi:5,10-methylenetetrahydromethanopterin reductase